MHSKYPNSLEAMRSLYCLSKSFIERLLLKTSFLPSRRRISKISENTETVYAVLLSVAKSSIIKRSHCSNIEISPFSSENLLFSSFLKKSTALIYITLLPFKSSLFAMQVDKYVFPSPVLPSSKRLFSKLSNSSANF